MKRYEVIFTDGPNSSMDDLMDLDQTIKAVVIQRALSVLSSELDPDDDDEQAVESCPPFKLRRAISRDQARRLRNTADLEPTDSVQAHDVWYVYRDFNSLEVQQHGGQIGFVVVRLITTTQFASLLEKLIHSK